MKKILLHPLVCEQHKDGRKLSNILKLLFILLYCRAYDKEKDCCHAIFF